MVLTVTPLISSISPLVTGCLNAMIEMVSIKAFEVLGAFSFHKWLNEELCSSFILSLYPDATSFISRDVSLYLSSIIFNDFLISDNSILMPSASKIALISEILTGLPAPNKIASIVLVILLFKTIFLLI